MSVFVNRNIENRWTKVEVTDAELAAIEKANFKANTKIAVNVMTYFPSLIEKASPGAKFDPTVVAALIPVMVGSMMMPMHWAIENYVDGELAKGKSTK